MSKKNDDDVKKKDDCVNEGHRERMFERYVAEGFNTFQDHQILEMLLFYCYPRIDTNKKAHKMINEFGSFNNLVEADPKEIAERCKVTLRVACLPSMIPQLAKRYELRRWEKRPVLESVEIAMDYVRTLFIGETVECFYIISLNASHAINGYDKVASGSVAQANINFQEVAKTVLRYKAVFAILAHNHPSGSIKPSADDRVVTNDLRDFLETMTVRVSDHLIVGGLQVFSFSKHNLCGLVF